MAEIGAWQLRHLPPKISQLMTGMLSYGWIGAPHSGHWDRGDTIDTPAGIRVMQTLRKLPINNPKRKNTAAITL
jgi:hypothetical protein